MVNCVVTVTKLTVQPRSRTRSALGLDIRDAVPLALDVAHVGRRDVCHVPLQRAERNSAQRRRRRQHRPRDYQRARFGALRPFTCSHCCPQRCQGAHDAQDEDRWSGAYSFSLISTTSCIADPAQVVRDFTATSLIGPSATPAEILNAQFISCLYHCTLNLSNLEPQFGSKVAEILSLPIRTLEDVYRRVTESLDVAIKREFSTILARIHRVDFSKPVDPMAMGSSSPYMQDLLDKLTFLRLEILGRSSLGEFMRQW